MVVSLILSGVATAIALAALGHTIHSARVERHDRREGLDLLREQITDERGRHAEQLELEQERRLDDRRADLVARQGAIHGGDPNDDHKISLTNGGRSTARNIRMRVVGEVTETLTSDHGVHDLVPGQTLEFRLPIPGAVGRGQRSISLWARWDDGAGEHDARLIALRPLR